MSKLPPILTCCDTCSNVSRTGGGSLFRCSTCKNHFYCSKDCPNKDWKEHKKGCSPFPEKLDPAKIQDDPDRKKALRDYCTLLQEWVNHHTKIRDNIVNGQLRFASARNSQAKALIAFSFPENLQFEPQPFSPTKYPYRSTLVLAARAGLIQLISQLTPSERDRLVKRIDRVNIPASSNWTRLFGPKVVSRPGGLSPGEYEVIGTLGSAFLLHGSKDELSPLEGLSMEDKDFWFMLAQAFKELWDAPKCLVYDA